MTALCSKLTLFKWRYSHRDRPSLLCSVLHSLCIHLFFLSPLIRCYYLASLEQLFLRRYALSIISLRSRLCLCSAKFLYRMESGLPLASPGHAIQRKNPQDESQRFSKWRLPTLPQRSAVPSAMLSLAAALASPLRCLRPPRAAGAHSPHPTPSATADTARASEAGLTTPELRLYRPTT